MSDLDPIELEIVMNTTELFAEAKKVIAAGAEIDAVKPVIKVDTADLERAAAEAEAARAGFASFIAELSRNNTALDERAKLTEQASAAIERHRAVIDDLQKRIEDTFDPTQIALYKYQAEQANNAINGLVEAANAKVEVMNTAELEAANDRIREAQALLDKISDSTIDVSFASPEELEVLSSEINKTEDAFQQLGTVIDFVQAKMSGMDPNSVEFGELSEDIRQANEMLGRTPVLYDATGNSIDQMRDALKLFQDQLAAETNPESIQILNQNIQTLEEGIKAVKNSGKTGFDEFGNKLKEQKEVTLTLQTELKSLVDQMAKLRLANKSNTAEYEELRNKAAEVRTAIASTNKEINSNTITRTSFDRLIQVTAGITAGFTMAQGAIALFGSENEEAQKVIQKVTGAMAVLQSLQQVQIQLKTRDTVATGSQTAAQAAYSLVVGTSTGALKLFRIALAATGIGLIIILLASLIANWDKVTASIKKSFPALEGFGGKLDKMKSYIMGFLRAYLSLYETVFKTIMKLINLDFKGALNEIKQTGENAKKSFNEGKAEQDRANLINRNREKVKKALETYNRETDLIEKRTGKTQHDRRAKAAAAEATLYDKGTKEYEEKMHDRNMIIADREKEQNDIQQRAADKRNKAAEAAAQKAQRIAEQAAEARKKVLEKIRVIEEEFENKRTEGNAIATIQKRYDKLRKEAEKVGVSKPDIMRIDIAEKKEIGDQQYRQQTTEYLKHLEQEKELFAAYEALKEKVGTDAARERYGAQLKEFQSYGERLQGEIAALENAGATEGPQLERLQELKDRLDEFNRTQLQAEQQRYAEAYEAAMTHQEKLAQIERDYQAQRLELEKITDEQLRAAKIAELDLQKNAAVDTANAEAFAKTEIFQRLSENLIGITRRDLKLRIQALKEYLAMGNGISDEQRAKIQKELQRAEAMLGKNDRETRLKTLYEQRHRLQIAINAQQEKGNEISEKLKEEWIQINLQITEAENRLKQFAQYAQDASGIFGQMASAVGDSNEGLSDTLSTIGEIAGIAGNAASAFASFATGDIVGGIKSAISAISGIFSIGKKSRESERKANEEMRKYYEEMAEKERAYQRMLRERERQIIRNNKLTLDGLRDSFKLMGQQQGQIQSQYERLLQQIQGSGQQVTGQHTEKYGGFLGIGRKTRVVQDLAGVGGMGFDQLEALYEQGKLTEGTAKLFEQLRKLKEEGANVAQTLEDLAREARELWTGTTADSITDAIVDGFRNGYRTAEDFADNFEDMMKNAMLNSFKYKVVEKQIEAFYNNFAAAADEGGLNEEKIAQLREQYAAMIAAMGEEFNNLASITGLGFEEFSANSLQGAYKAASQESIDLLAGQTGGMRLAQLETNQILRNGYAQQLEHASHSIRLQIQIEENTRRTANNTEVLPLLHDTLKRVESVLKENKNALGSIGIK